jgi:hypothetical protein
MNEESEKDGSTGVGKVGQAMSGQGWAMGGPGSPSSSSRGKDRRELETVGRLDREREGEGFKGTWAVKSEL